jgi:outer membrane protein OmpA-like peptidoglycan-associated protein
LATLKVFARTRGIHTIQITGFGDVDNSDARVQAAGLRLALDRARVVAAFLSNVGVPPASLRVGAEAQGSGAIARLTD